MSAQISYPKVAAVEPLENKRLRVTFVNGAQKVYDCRALMEEEMFRPLRDEALFKRVQADPHGYAVIWNDEIDLSESELWLHGESADSRCVEARTDDQA